MECRQQTCRVRIEDDGSGKLNQRLPFIAATLVDVLPPACPPSLLAEGKPAQADTKLATVTRLAGGRETAMRHPLVRARIVAAESLLTRSRLPEAQHEIETALHDSHKVAGSRDALYLGSAMLISSRIAAAQARYLDAEQTATSALHLFEQRARSPDTSADVGEALLVLAQERRARGDPRGAAELRVVRNPVWTARWGRIIR